MIPVVILCGGFGTRLRSVVEEKPKVLAPVAGRPFLAYVIDLLRTQGLGEEIWLSTGYMADQVAAFAESVDKPGQRVRCIEEAERLGTGGALQFAVPSAGIEGPFLAMNGDTWFDAPLRTLASDCLVRKPGEWVVALTPMRHADRYGTVEYDESTRQIRSFREKHPIGEISEWINAGVYLGWSQNLDGSRFRGKFSLETDVFPAYLNEGLLYARPFPQSTFLDIGIPVDYAKAEAILG